MADIPEDTDPIPEKLTLESEDPEPPAAAQPEPPASDQQEPPAKHVITCPKCQTEQPRAAECIFCGYILSRSAAAASGGTVRKSTKGPAPGADEPHPGSLKARRQARRRMMLGLAAATVVLVGMAAAAVYYNQFRKMTTDEVVARTEPAIACIQHDHGNGSGFLVMDDVLVTNYHVIQEVFPEHIDIYFPAVSDNIWSVTRVLYYDEYRDLALLEVESDQEPLMFSTKKELRNGEDLIIIGSPGVSDTVLSNSVTRGSLNSERTIDGKTFLQISAAVNPGNSGGPALNYRGEVVAVVTMKASAQDGITFGIPMADVAPAVRNVHELSDSQKNTANTRFLANIAYKRLKRNASANLRMIHLYVQSMHLAEKHALQPSDGLKIVRRKIGPDLAETNAEPFFRAMDDTLSMIRRRPDLEPEIIDGLGRLRACAEDIRKLAENPARDPVAVAERHDHLKHQMQRISEKLELKLFFTP